MTRTGLRVLLLSTSFPLRGGASSGVFVARLAQHYAERVQVTALVPADDVSAPPAAPGGLALHAFRYAPRRLRVLAHLPGGIPVALRRRPAAWLLVPALLAAMAAATWRRAARTDLVHANWAICGCIAGLVGRLRGLPVVTTLRGEDVTRGHRAGLQRFVLRACVRLSTRVVGVSEAMVQWLRAEFPQAADRIVAIPNGVDPALLEIAVPRPRPDGVLRVLSVGSLIPRKGMELIIGALAHLDEHVRLRIVGDGPERDALHALALRLGVAERVEFSGAVAPQAMAGVYAEADLFVLASYSEGRPNVVVEALAAGLPVVATGIAGVRELISDGRSGLLVPPARTEALAAAIARLVADVPLRRTLGAAGREQVVRAGLTWDRAAARYLDLFHALAGPGGRPCAA